MAGTDAEFEVQARVENNQGDAIVSTLSRDATERRMLDYMQRANGGGAPNNNITWRRFLVQLWYFAANHGTGKRVYWEGREINYTDNANVGRVALAEGVWDRIIGNPDNVANQAFPLPRTVKAYLRSRALTIIRVFKKAPTGLTRWQRMGLPEEYKYLGADFFESSNVLNEEESQVVDAAKQVQLFRSATKKQLNNAVQYTGATASNTAGHVQANAKRQIME